MRQLGHCASGINGRISSYHKLDKNLCQNTSMVFPCSNKHFLYIFLQLPLNAALTQKFQRDFKYVVSQSKHGENKGRALVIQMCYHPFLAIIQEIRTRKLSCEGLGVNLLSQTCFFLISTLLCRNTILANNIQNNLLTYAITEEWHHSPHPYLPPSTNPPPPQNVRHNFEVVTVRMDSNVVGSEFTQIF